MDVNESVDNRVLARGHQETPVNTLGYSWTVNGRTSGQFMEIGGYQWTFVDNSLTIEDTVETLRYARGHRSTPTDLPAQTVEISKQSVDNQRPSMDNHEPSMDNRRQARANAWMCT